MGLCRRFAGNFAAIMLAELILSGASAAWGDVALDKYNLAIGLYKQERWARAAERFEIFLKDHPQHEKAPLAKFYLGLTYINEQDYKAARAVLRDFVKSHPTNTNIAQGRYRVAECSYLLDDLKAALPELKEFLDKHPQDPLAERAIPYLGDVYLRLGQADGALAAFDRAIKDYPTSSLIDDARFGRAKALEALKRDAEAVQQYQELAQKSDSPRAAEAQFQLAARQFEMKRFSDAAAAYRDLLQRFPKSSLVPAARLNAGYALFQNGEFAEAEKQFAEAQRDAPNSLTARYWRGLSLKAMGDVAQAATVLADAAKEAGDAPLAESIHFQRAICARQLGDAATARDLFVEGADRWPKGEFADDCLHAACELAVDAGDVPAATKLLARLTKEYPGSGLRLHYELLSGRMELAAASADVKSGKGADDRYAKAAEKFERVLKESMIVRTQFLARYYLALTRQLQNQHQEALNVLAPVVESVQTEGAKSEFGEALLVQAESLLAVKQFDAARAAAEKYLSLFSRQLPRALFTVAVAAAHLKDEKASAAALDRLTTDFRTYPLTPAALLQLAELAENQQDWPTAASRYTALSDLAAGTDNQAFALRGLAWAHFKQRQFRPAADNFGRVVKQFPNHKLVSECAYYLAESLREDGRLDEALAAFDDVVKRFGPEKPAAAGAEQNPPLIYAYLASLQRARTHRQRNDVTKADEAYARLFELFPHPVHLDRLLDEWALMNYEAENFARADDIFRRLVKETPDSPLADNARLSLAESDLVAGKLDQAKKAFEELSTSDKSDAEVKERSAYQLLILAVEQKRWADVRPLSERLERDFPESRYRTYARYAQAEAILSNADAGEEALAKAKENLAAVMQAATEGLAKDAFEGRAWVLSAEIAFREKKYEDVARIAEDFKRRLPESIFHYQAEEIVGRGHKQQANFAEARASFERVLADPAAFRTPTAAKCQFLIGETYFLEEKWEEAFLAYQKVYASYDHPEWQAAALLQSGKCDEKLNQWKEAAKTYAKLLDEFPESEFAKEAQERLELAKKKAAR